MIKNKEKNLKRIVVKFGGSSLADHKRILRAVTAVAKEARKSTQIAVIVSAMGKTTDILFQAAKNSSNGKLHKKDLDEILALADRIAVVYEGEIVGIVDRADATIEQLGLMMAGVRADSAI